MQGRLGTVCVLCWCWCSWMCVCCVCVCVCVCVWVCVVLRRSAGMQVLALVISSPPPAPAARRKNSNHKINLFNALPNQIQAKSTILHHQNTLLTYFSTHIPHPLTSHLAFLPPPFSPILVHLWLPPLSQLLLPRNPLRVLHNLLLDPFPCPQYLTL